MISGIGVLLFVVGSFAAVREARVDESQFGSLDQNADGRLSMEEFAPTMEGLDAVRIKRAFIRHDANDNGSLDSVEFLYKAHRQLRDADGRPDPRKLFTFLDRDADAHLTLLEYLADRQGTERASMTIDFEWYDLDADRRLTRSEFDKTPLAWPGEEVQSQAFGDFDLNDNRELSLAEFLGPLTGERRLSMEKEFPLADVDANGQLSFEEFRWSAAVREDDSIQIQRRDKDEDGQVASLEFSDFRADALKRQCPAIFESSDSDGDGHLSAAEFTLAESKFDRSASPSTIANWSTTVLWLVGAFALLVVGAGIARRCARRAHRIEST